LTIGAPVALAFCGLYVVAEQYRHTFFSNFDWPSHFESVNDLAWLSIILLAADVLVELLRSPPSEEVVGRDEVAVEVVVEASTPEGPTLDGPTPDAAP
jgi:hypothetical protein